MWGFCALVFPRRGLNASRRQGITGNRTRRGATSSPSPSSTAMAYIGWLISKCPDNWNYGVIKTLQSWLCPLLDALKTLCEEGLTTALVLSAVDHR